jgi:hypothetical protein
MAPSSVERFITDLSDRWRFSDPIKFLKNPTTLKFKLPYQTATKHPAKYAKSINNLYHVQN